MECRSSESIKQHFDRKNILGWTAGGDNRLKQSRAKIFGNNVYLISIGSELTAISVDTEIWSMALGKAFLVRASRNSKCMTVTWTVRFISSHLSSAKTPGYYLPFWFIILILNVVKYFSLAIFRSIYFRLTPALRFSSFKDLQDSFKIIQIYGLIFFNSINHPTLHFLKKVIFEVSYSY